jgi:hypothetical protein
MMNTLNVGDKVTLRASFTSPIGASFRAGAVFIVDLVGESVRMRAAICGSVVWVSWGHIALEDIATINGVSYVHPRAPEATKACQFCGAAVPHYAAIVGCSPCQAANRQKFRTSHPWLFRA